MSKFFSFLLIALISQSALAQPMNIDVAPDDRIRFEANNTTNEIGFTAVPIGNFNGDSRLDYAIADPINNRVFIITPRANSLIYNLNNLFFTRNGFTVSGNVGSDFGLSLSAIGDFNQDGFDDLAIGAPTDGIGGRVYVLAGSSTYGPGGIEVSDTGAFLLIVEGGDGELLGRSIGRKSNINADRFTDLLLPSEFRSTVIDGESRTGAYHVIYGADSFTQNTGTVDVLDSTQVLTITAPSITDVFLTKFGTIMEPVGDVTGDGNDDVAFFQGIDLVNNSSAIAVIPGGNKLTGTQPVERLLFPIFTTTLQVFADPLMMEVSSMAGSDLNQDGTAELVVGFSTANLYGGFEPKGAVAVISEISGTVIDSLLHPNVDWYGHWKTNSRLGSTVSVYENNIAVGAPFADSVFNYQDSPGAVYFLTLDELPSGQNYAVQKEASAVVYGGTGGVQLGSSVHIDDFDLDGHLDLFTSSVGDTRDEGAVAYQTPVVFLKHDFNGDKSQNYRDLMILSNYWQTTQPSLNLAGDDGISAFDLLQWKENESIK